MNSYHGEHDFIGQGNFLSVPRLGNVVRIVRCLHVRKNNDALIVNRSGHLHMVDVRMTQELPPKFASQPSRLI